MGSTYLEQSLPITVDQNIMSGTPVFRGTRVPVQTLFEYWMDGCTLEEFLDNFPTVSREAVFMLLAHAAKRQGISPTGKSRAVHH
jgi:uncharacterized protein (DUF433 family)